MKHKTILKTYGVLTALAVALRFVQLAVFTEHSTGFMKPEKAATYISVGIFAVIVGLVSVIYIISGFMSRRQPTCRPDPKTTPFLGVMSFLMAGYCIITGAVEALSALIKDKGIDAAAAENSSLIGPLLVSIASIAAAAFFVLYGVKNKVSLKLPPLLTVAPIVYFAVRLIIAFSAYSGVAAITESVLEILLLCLLVVFFVLHGKILSVVEVRKSCRQILPLGLICFMISAIYAIPPVLLTVAGVKLHAAPTVDSLGGLLAGVYALVFVLYLYRRQEGVHVKHSVENLEIDIPSVENFYNGDQ